MADTGEVIRRLRCQLKDCLAVIQEMSEVDAAVDTVSSNVISAVRENSEEAIRLAREWPDQWPRVRVLMLFLLDDAELQRLSAELDAANDKAMIEYARWQLWKSTPYRRAHQKAARKARAQLDAAREAYKARLRELGL